MASFKRIFKGGVNVPHRKNTADSETVIMGVPDKVVIPMHQHVGAPCIPTVKKGDSVKVGQIIGNSEKYVSVPIHSSVSGVVEDIGQILYPGGSYVTTVQIKTDGRQEVDLNIKPPSYETSKEFVKAIRDSGLVGLGGAGFPTHVKLSPPPGKNIDTLIVNGAECEPYITSDYREAIENSQNVVSGINILMEILNIENVSIGIEDNKPEAIRILTEMTDKNNKINVAGLKSRYPQGAEKMLIYSITGRKVPPGKLPLDVGVIVMNINSVSFVSEYVKTGMPLTEKRITVDGDAVVKPSNVRVLVGTSLKDVFEFCGGFKNEPGKILMGGPMMGVSQYSLDAPVLKYTNAVLAYEKEAVELAPELPCIRCGRCVEACPMNLLPLFINMNSTTDNIEELEKYHVNDCIECGSCSYVCPSKRHLVQSIRLAKANYRKLSAKGRE